MVKNRRGSETLVNIGIVIVCIVGWMAFMTTIGFLKQNYYDGFPKTHQGSVIYVTYKWNKWGSFDYTDVEMLTYSGDSHHVTFWGHANFEIGRKYIIRTNVEYQWFDLVIGWQVHERIVSVTFVQDNT